MFDQKKLIVSHAPFWHDGSRISTRSFHTMLAALPAAIFGVIMYGFPAHNLDISVFWPINLSGTLNYFIIIV
jgi:hypothetical protein